MFGGNSSFGQRDQSPKAQFKKKSLGLCYRTTPKKVFTGNCNSNISLTFRSKIIFTFHFSFRLFERPRIPGISGPHEDKWGKKKELEEFSHKILCPKYWSDITRQMSCK